MVELVIGIVDQPATLKFLFDDARVPRYRYFIAQRQPQVGHATEGVLAIGAVEMEHAKLQDVPVCLALPFAIGSPRKVTRDYGVAQIDSHNLSFQVCPQLLPRIGAWTEGLLPKTPVRR